jgi:hypothetical protein
VSLTRTQTCCQGILGQTPLTALGHAWMGQLWVRWRSQPCLCWEWAATPTVLLGATQAAKYSWQATQHLLDAPPPVALLATDHLWTQAELLAGNTGQWADNWGEPPDLVTSQRDTAQQTKLAMQWVSGAAQQQAAAGNPAGARPATASDAAAVLQALESSTGTRPKGQSDTPPTRHQRRAGPVTAQTTYQGAAQVVAATNAAIQGSLSLAADQAGGQEPGQQLALAPVPAGFYSAAWTEGITVLKLFGGVCAGLEMALRNGCKVARYIYADTDSAARRVAAYRVQALDQRYTGQLAADACADSGALGRCGTRVRRPGLSPHQTSER